MLLLDANTDATYCSSNPEPCIGRLTWPVHIHSFIVVICPRRQVWNPGEGRVPARVGRDMRAHFPKAAESWQH